MPAIAPFTFQSFPVRVAFRQGATDDVAQEAARLGSSRLFLIGSARWLVRLQDALAGLAAASFADAAQHTPVEVTERALALLTDNAADGILSVGGGSAIGLGKALALRTRLPHIVLPTTYSGSEMTDMVGEARKGVKTTVRDPAIRPASVLYDPLLTRTLDLRTSAASGLNSIAHGVEALYAPDGNPVVRLMALEGIGAMFRALGALVANPLETDARDLALYGAWLNGMCMGSTTMGLHHKLCHVLGGMFGLSHAEMHAALLPHSMAYHRPAVPAVIADLAQELGVPDPVYALAMLLREAGLPTSLAALGMPAEGIEATADLAMKDAYANPRPIARAALVSMLRSAHAGDVPPTG